MCISNKLVIVLAVICMIAQCLPCSNPVLGKSFIGPDLDNRKRLFNFPISEQKCCDRQIFTMSGYGEIEVKPDIANLQVSFEQIGKTSQNAISLVNKKVNNLITILQKNGIQDKDISTNSLNVFPRYNFINGNQVFIGQVATQSLTIKLRNIGVNGSGVGPIIDAISGVDGIRIQGINFDLQNKTAELLRARKSAFDNASEKANDYVSFSNTKVGDVLKIQDFDFQVGSVDQQNSAADRLPSISNPTTIIADNLKISTSVTVLFEILQ